MVAEEEFDVLSEPTTSFSNIYTANLAHDMPDRSYGMRGCDARRIQGWYGNPLQDSVQPLPQ
jgi:hypothetical protein